MSVSAASGSNLPGGSDGKCHKLQPANTGSQ